MENENFSTSSLFFTLSRFTLLSERNLVYTVYKFCIYIRHRTLVHGGRKLRSCLRNRRVQSKFEDRLQR